MRRDLPSSLLFAQGLRSGRQRTIPAADHVGRKCLCRRPTKLRQPPNNEMSASPPKLVFRPEGLGRGSVIWASLRLDARRVSREVGIEAGLHHGGAELRRPTIGAGEVERARPEARGKEQWQKARFTMNAEPCPFCTSSEVRPHVTAEARVVMKCDDCGASGPVCIDELNAVRSWNRRPATPDQDWD